MNYGERFIIGKFLFMWTAVGWEKLRIATCVDRREFKRLTDFCGEGV